MAQQAVVASLSAGESSVSRLAQFFPEAVPVRLPVRVTVAGGRGESEATVIEYATASEVLFASALPLEFDDRLRVENGDGSLSAEVWVVALQYHEGRTAIAARFFERPANWIIQP